MKQLMNLKETQIIINHSRRFNNRFKNLKQKIKNQIFGNPFRLDIYTYGEWKKNGIHIIDTLVYLFDSQIIINEIKIEKTKTKIKTSEWTDILLRISDLFIVNINYVPEKYYQLFEMDFKFENARINFQDFEYAFMQNLLGNILSFMDVYEKSAQAAEEGDYITVVEEFGRAIRRVIIFDSMLTGSLDDDILF